MSSIRRPLPPSRRGPGWPLIAILGAGVVALGVVWFAFGGPLTGSDGEGTDRYVEAVVGAPSRINPLFAYLNDADRDLATLVFSGLTRLSQDGGVLPDLAASWDQSSDGRSVTFHLRPGIVWHTGVTFTSADVLFTYNLLADTNLQGDPDQAPLWRQLKCSAPDDLTVLCELPEPFAPFLAYATMGIVPQHILQGTDAASLFNSPFNQAPVGTGPFRLAQLDQTHAVLKANPSYHLGAPALNEIDFRFYPNGSSAAADIVRGEADGVLLDSGASQSDFDTLTSTSGLKAYTANRTAYTVLYLNNGRAPLNDKSVRQAIAETVDIDALIGEILGGRAVRANSPIVPGTWASNPEIQSYKHDPGEARKLLEEAGWKLPPEGDVRQRDNVELRISLMTDLDPLRGAIADEIARELADIGIAATVARQDSTDLIRDFLIPRQYQAAIFGWEPGPDPDPYPAWHSSQASGNGRNLAAFQNEEADKIMEEARRTTDLDRRQQLYYTFQAIFHDNVPSVLLYYPVYTYFVREKVKGIELGTLFYPSSRFGNVQQWRLEKTADIGGR